MKKELAHDMKHMLRQLGHALNTATKEEPDFYKQQRGLFKLSESTGNVKRKELIAVAVSIYSQCPYCIVYHLNNAIKAGATRAEIMEAATVAVELGGGVVITYLSYVIDGCDQLGAKW